MDASNQSGSGWTKWGTKPFRKFEGVPISLESLEWAQSQKLLPTDVIILTFPKSGTTWMANICQQIRSGGTGFDHFTEITQLIPWLEFMYDVDQTLDDPDVNKHFPRCFKSHQLPSAICPGAKYLTIVRDPESVLLSWFAFNSIKGITSQFKNADEYIEKNPELFGGEEAIFGTNVWDFMVELWEIRNEPNVITLCYEDLKKDPNTSFPKIAKFIGVDLGGDPKKLSNIEKWTSWETMKKNMGKFDDNFISSRMKAKMKTVEEEKADGEDEGVEVPAPKIDTHQGKRPVLSEKSKLWMQQQWKERVTPKTGHETYEEFAKAIVEASSASMNM